MKHPPSDNHNINHSTKSHTTLDVTISQLRHTFESINEFMLNFSIDNPFKLINPIIIQNRNSLNQGAGRQVQEKQQISRENFESVTMKQANIWGFSL